MTKKQKKVIPKPALTKRQLSKWQRQVRIRRIVIIAAVVFLVGISGWVGYGYYKDYKSDPLRQVVIKVNDVPFTMNYYIGTLDAYTRSMNTSEVQYMTDFVSNQIVQGELMRQGADRLGIKVTVQEIDEIIKKNKLPNDNVYQDLVKASLLSQKLPADYFSNNLSTTMEQAHLQVMLVESKEVADEVITKIEASGNFSALVEEFSCNPEIEGDFGWLPKELIPNTMIADAAFNLTQGKISQPIYDKTANKNVGYWLIEVTDKQDEKIKARVMLLGNETEAERVKTELAAGGNFSALAGNYSQHGSKNNGGELGWLKQGDIGSNAFNKIAFNITTNVVSEPVKDTEAKTTGGYWVVQVVDKGEHELSDAVKQKLANNNFSSWLQEQEKNSTIKNYLDAAKKAWAVTEVLRGR